MSSVFISYRRDDSAGHAGRIFDALAARLGREQVVIDVESVRPGEDFREALRAAIDRCAACLVVIGPRWLDARDDRAAWRLGEPDDVVRAEIEAALATDTLVVPVLVGGAAMPRSGDLPPSLRPLARRHAVELADVRWDDGLARLLGALGVEGDAPAGPSGAAGAPTGAVSFLVTEVDGSAALWEQHRDAMPDALRRHDAIVRAAIADRGGHVFRAVGDAYAAAFWRPQDAIAAAVTAQRELTAEPWPAAVSLRVRMAVHTGVGDERDGDYAGPAVNRAARLLAIGHGGQVLVSGVSAALAGPDLPPGIALEDLGEHRLKDLTGAERVFALTGAGLPAELPALRSLGNPGLPNNLPEQTEPVIGRETEIAEVRSLLERARVVTLTGAGGAGKTRLALQVAAELLDGSGDGVWLAELASVEDPAGVASAVGEALGMREDPERPMADRLPEYLAERRLLLILDNCEHLLAACADLAGRIVRRSRDVVILATSREPLGVAGEHAYRVPSLPLPPAGADPDEVERADAVRLFVERARRGRPDFALTAENAEPVADICRRLDGMPLSIELAAARSGAMSPAEIRDRLDQRFRLLTGGRRSALARQQSLHATVDWSYRLLEPVEQDVLCRLSVFAGSFDLPAAEAVGEAGGADAWAVLDALTALIDKSLVQAEPDGETTRYRLLETIRDFAAEELLRAGEDAADAARLAHAEHYLRLAESAEPELRGEAQVRWLDRLEREDDELQLALTGLVERPSGGPLAVRLAAALNRYWHIRGYSPEVRGLVEAAVAHPTAGAAPADAQVMALLAATTMSNERGALQEGLAFAEDALAVGRTASPAVRAFALQAAAFNLSELGEPERAGALLDEAVDLAAASADRWVQAIVGCNLTALISSRASREEDAARLLEAVDDLHGLGDEAQLAATLNDTANVELELGRLDDARRHLHESIAAAERVRDEITLSFALVTLASVLAAEGAWSDAEAAISRLARLMERIGVDSHRPYMLLVLAGAAEAAGEPGHAAELHGALDASLRAFGTDRLQGVEQRLREEQERRLREALGEAAFTAALEAGRRIDVVHLLAQVARAPAPVAVAAA